MECKKVFFVAQIYPLVYLGARFHNTYTVAGKTQLAIGRRISKSWQIMKPMCNLCFLFVFGGLAKNTISCPYGSDANSFSDLENRVYHACCRCFLANSELEVCYILRAKFLNIFSYQPFFALRTRKFCVSLWSAIGRPFKNFCSYTYEVDYGICTFEI